MDVEQFKSHMADMLMTDGVSDELETSLAEFTRERQYFDIDFDFFSEGTLEHVALERLAARLGSVVESASNLTGYEKEVFLSGLYLGFGIARQLIEATPRIEPTS